MVVEDTCDVLHTGFGPCKISPSERFRLALWDSVLLDVRRMGRLAPAQARYYDEVKAKRDHFLLECERAARWRKNAFDGD